MASPVLEVRAIVSAESTPEKELKSHFRIITSPSVPSI